MDRRKFLGAMAAASGLGLLAAPSSLWADDDGENASPVLFQVPTNLNISGNVLIVGGGMAGATLAKYLRLWGGSGLNVTLVEKSPYYTSNIMSNAVLNGQRSLTSLNYAYDTLVRHYGVTLVTGEVSEIDAASQQVLMADGSARSYERLVLAPGLDFDLMPGMTSLAEYDTLIPHAWKAGLQTQLLRSQLVAMQAGSDVIITIPKAPYRCPPGPYERTCVIADWLKTNKPGSKVIVLDANADILVEKENFSRAFTVTHAGIVDYRPGSTVTHVDSSTKTVTYTFTDAWGDVQTATLTAGVLNPIPPQRAPQLLADAGLLNSPDGRFAGVDVLSYESTAQSGIHIIGDASHTTQPKAGHIANQEAKTCADAIVRMLQGEEPDPNPVTNSACFTPITATTATWLSAVYQYDATTQKMVIPPQHNSGKAIAAPAATKENYEDMLVWFKTLMGDTFS
jgi:NADH dehydrogenase FAD-containing subunit